MIHVVMATHDVRKGDWATLRDRLVLQGVSWHVIRSPKTGPVTDGELNDEEYSRLKGATIHRPASLLGSTLYCKLNLWIDGHAQPAGRDFVHFLNDDDLVPSYFYGDVQKVMDANPEVTVMIVSMERGHFTVPGNHPHPTTPLLAHPEWMTPTRVGVEQIIIREDVLSKYRFQAHPLDDVADGHFIQKVVTENVGRVLYLPHLNVYFNALERGRWKVIP